MLLRRILLKAFLKVLPQKYIPDLTRHLTAASYVRCGYSEYDVYLEQGIATAAEDVEPELVEWIKNQVRPDQVLYDVGANVGAYSLIAAKCHGDRLKVFAFEPAAATTAVLIRNIIHNDCQHIVSPMSFPLSRRPMLAPFNYHRDTAAGRALHTYGDAVNAWGEDFKPAFQEYMVSSSIDQLVFDYGVAPPNYIKIDVDGLEFEILAGAERVLRSGTVRSIFFEVGTRFEMAAVAAYLNECGFESSAVFKHDHASNVIFVSRNSRVA